MVRVTRYLSTDSRSCTFHVVQRLKHTKQNREVYKNSKTQWFDIMIFKKYKPSDRHVIKAT